MEGKWTNEILKFADENWHKPIGLISAAILLIAVLFIFLSQFQFSEITLLFIYLLSTLSLLFIWFKTNSIKKTKKGKVGFIVSIATTDETEKVKIREDFISTLEELLKRGRTGKSFDFISAPNHIARKVTDFESAILLRKKCRGHFLIYGRVRLRPIQGQNVHIINLEGLVSHKPMLEKMSRKIANEFAALFPRRVNLTTENDVVLFDFTSIWTLLVAKYIIGIAASQSGDLNYSELLYQEVLESLKNMDHSFPVFNKLKTRIPLRLTEIYETKAGLSYDAWRTTKDEYFITALDKELNKIDKKHKNRYSFLLLRSLFLFLDKRDTIGAIEQLKRCKRQRDATWRLNLAFLYSYLGDLKKAYKEYNLSQKLSIEVQILNEIEEFICYILEIETEKYQLYYSLGVINHILKGDSVQAVKDFKSFLNKRRNDEFIIEEQQVKNWLTNIESKKSIKIKNRE